MYGSTPKSLLPQRHLTAGCEIVQIGLSHPTWCGVRMPHCRGCEMVGKEIRG